VEGLAMTMTGTNLDQTVLLTSGRFTVRELVLTPEKAMYIWTQVNKYRTLFSDLTRGDIKNFMRFITDVDSLWLEIDDSEKMIGVLCLTNLHKIVDTDAHILFFDVMVSDKIELGKELIKWTFSKLPLERVSVDVPAFYHRTRRMVQNMGFKLEGERRRAVLIGGNWVNVLLFGITRGEAFR
jgi:hypothetical protein